MTTNEFIEYNKIIAICRRMDVSDILKLAEALQKGGVLMMEVTFDQSNVNCCRDTARAIEALNREFGDSMRIGAGTVLTEEQVFAAKAAGAKYIISPNVNTSVIQTTKREGMTSIPGASTPSEIEVAYESGADFVKLFPAGFFGTGYFKDVRAPLSHIKLIATAGINETNLASFMEAGAIGAGISSYLTSKELVKEGRFDELTRRAAIMSAIAAQYRET